MKKIVYCVIFLLIFKFSFSQNLYSPAIDSIKNLVSSQLIKKYDRELSGDTTTTVGGNTVKILSRKTTSPYNPVAAQYIYEKFTGFGVNASYQVNSATCVNVIGTKTGTKYPNKQFIICAHYDDYSNNSFDTIPGADDNASGVCGVLEAARLLANFNSEYTIKFIAFDEEEDWMIGSYAYADSAFARGDSILGVFNLDMIGFDVNNTNKCQLTSNNASLILSSSYINSLSIYQVPIHPQEFISETTASDQLPFWEKGYRGIFTMEWDFNPYYHSNQEKFSKLNLTYFTNMIKASVATLASWCTDRYLSVRHNPAVSGQDTSAKTLIFKIQSPVKLGVSGNVPRVYYKINSGNYSYINYFYSGHDTLKYRMPGQIPGTIIYYYFAIQDSSGSTCVTLPGGGSGVNPPGTTAPANPYRYEVYSDYNQCSNSLPKTISDLQLLYDTIPVNQNNKLVNKIKVNLTIYHPNDGDLIIQFIGPNQMINLSQGNGSGGANYINTTFDDSASLPITQGAPPFTGNFKPQSSLSIFNNQPATSNWTLRIFDSKTGDTGILVNWCVLLQLKNPIGIKENIIPIKNELHQNYPNPFNPVTNIRYQIAKNSFVLLKIYDVLGREVTTLVKENLKAGEYEVIFNGSRLASGIYFYKLITSGFTDTKRMVLIK